MRRPLQVVAILLVSLTVATLLAQRALPERLAPDADETDRLAILDRSGVPLTISYQGRWNLDDQRRLESIPRFVRTAVVEAEDRRYWSHHGVDWRARLGAVWQDLRAGHAVRGASTITEQAVRLLHPRPRTVWSRWVEGFEAMRLEARFSKSEILELYLNQVPFAANRRGVVQAARYAYGRELSTLSEPEMLALAVMPRAPSRLDPARDPAALAGPVRRLVARLQADGLLSAAQVAAASSQPAAFHIEDDSVPAANYLAEVRRRAAQVALPAAPLRGSLDASIQRDAQALLDSRVQDLSRSGVRQGALLVVDLTGNRIRAWAVTNLDAASGDRGIDTVLAARQPGSALKPFVYALALQSGWTAATTIEDGELAARVGDGMHPYRNYSRLHYGTVTVREALGNSLNVPAVKALQFVGGDRFLQLLRRLGMDGLTAHPEFYGDGLALGNGEVTLYQLVQAYTVLASRGRLLPLTLFEEPLERTANASTPVIDRDVASIITDILSDARARRLEFGDGGLLRFPAQTAVKTGTSTDYRDAWCVAYNHRYVVGAWMGDLSGRSMDGVTGSIGPALLVRSTLAGLMRNAEPEPLWRSPALVSQQVAGPDGGTRREWFASSTPPQPAIEMDSAAIAHARRPTLLQPFEGLRIAFDPRVPAQQQALEFQLDAQPAEAPSAQGIDWYVDDVRVAQTALPRYQWPVSRGHHSAYAVAIDSGWRTPDVHFLVK
jgi:penicillin-binding protein 1C